MTKMRTLAETTTKVVYTQGDKRRGITHRKQKQQSLTKIGQENNVAKTRTTIRIRTKSDTDCNTL